MNISNKRTMSKYEKKDYGHGRKSKESTEEENKYPNWLNGQVRRTRSATGDNSEFGELPPKRRVQFRKRSVQSESNSVGRRRSQASTSGIKKVRKPRTRSSSGRSTKSSDREAGFAKHEVTLKTIREALDDETLTAILDGSFNPYQVVTLKYKIQGLSKLAEDSYRQPIKSRRKRRVKGKTKPPSVKYGELYNRFTRGEIALDAYVILGRYFMLYKELYDEEDPEFVGKSVSTAIYNINQMASLLTNGDFNRILDYVDKLMPLWAKQLRESADFPNGRPTFNTFFVKRTIWTQRFSLVRRWS